MEFERLFNNLELVAQQFVFATNRTKRSVSLAHPGKTFVFFVTFVVKSNSLLHSSDDVL